MAGDPYLEAVDQLDATPPQAAPEEQEDPYAHAIDTIDQEDKRRQEQGANLLRWRDANTQTDPGRRVDVLRYSAASGLAPDFVEKNLDNVKRQVDADKVDWNRVIQEQPALAQMLLDKPHTQPLVKDDAVNLKGVEWGLKATTHALLDAANEQRAVARMNAEYGGAGGEENRKHIADLEAQYSNKDYGEEGFFQKAMIGGVRILPFVAGDILARTAGGFLGGMLGLEAGAATGGAAGLPAAGVGAAPGAAAGGLIGAVTGGAAGQQAGSFLFNSYESIGPLYWQLSNLKDSDGKPLDPAVARAFATAGGALNGLIGSVGFGKLGGTKVTQSLMSIPGAKQMLARFGTGAVEKALTQQAPVAIMKRLVLGYGEHVGVGASMMAVQGAINQAAIEGSKGASSGNFETQWSTVGDALGNGFIKGITDMSLLAAHTSGREMLGDIGRARLSAENASRLEMLTESARGSKLLERSPQEFQDFVARTKKEDGAVKNVIIPHEEWTRYWQEKKVDPAEMAASVIGDDGKAFSEAVATGGDLVIPVEKYLSKLARTEHAEGLAPDAKLYQDELTPRQQAAEEKRVQENMKEQAKTRGAEIGRDKQDLFTILRDQAVSAGQSKSVAEANAELTSSNYAALALRMGISVREAASLGRLDQLQVLGPKGEAAAVEHTQRLREFLAPNASMLLADRLGSTAKAPEFRSREVFIDQGTGLLNEKAFNEVKSDKPLVGHISVEGIKYLNDNVSHDHADGLYRAVAKELHAIDPQAAKVGGDFAVRVNSEAELQDILKRVNEALPVKGFEVTGKTGKTFGDAGTAHGDAKKAAEAAGARAKRGQKPLGLQEDATATTFPADKASAAVPEELHNRVAGLSDEAYFHEAYVEPHTGLLTNEGWSAIPRKAAVAAFDLRGLKLANESFGTHTGDEMIRRFGEIASHIGGSSFDFAHLHGDEYAAQHSDPAVLEAFVARLNETLQNVGIPALLNGEPVEVPVAFRHGIGESTYESADQDLNRRKAGEKAKADAGRDGEPQAGRSEAGRPSDVPGGPNLGAGDAGRGVEGQAEGGTGEARQGIGGRGARPQSFPGGGSGEESRVVAHVEGAALKYEQAAQAIPGPLWHSAAEKAAVAAKQEKGNAASWKAVISKTPGVKAEELETSGFNDWLTEQKGTITKDQVAEFFRANQLEVTEQVLGEKPESMAAYLSKDIDFLKGHGIEATIPSDSIKAKFELVTPEALEVDGEVVFKKGERLTSPVKILHYLRETSVPESADLQEVEGAMGYMNDVLTGKERGPRGTQYEQYKTEGGQNYRELLIRTPAAAGYEAPHFGSEGKGLLAHARFQEHTTADGQKVMLIEEVQSDLHQTGREKGYKDPKARSKVNEAHARVVAADQNLTEHLTKYVDRHEAEAISYNTRNGQEKLPDAALSDPEAMRRVQEVRDAFRARREAASDADAGVPNAPFKETWEPMVIRRLIRYAAEQGYSKIAWTTGETQADRYGLAQHVSKIRYNEEHKLLQPYGKDGQPLQGHSDVKPEDLAGIVGREAAAKLLARPHETPFKAQSLKDYAQAKGGDAPKGGLADLWVLVGADGEIVNTEKNQADAERKADTLNQYNSGRVLEGEDLKLGGEGMKVAYDKRIPSHVKKIVEKFGGKVSKEMLAGEATPEPAPSWDMAGGSAVPAAGREVWTATLPDALREKVVSEGMPLFQKGDKGDSRGSISMKLDPAGKPTSFRIEALRGDSSTFAHEMFHFMSWSLHEIAHSDLATQDIKNDYSSLLKWGGWDSAEARIAENKERNELEQKANPTDEEKARLKKLTAKEERLSHGWEQYLAEGVAPSDKLQPVFSRFAKWMTRIYKGLTGIQDQYRKQYGEELGLSDDVRQIFDRLLAVEQSTENARRETGADVEDPARAAMTPAEVEKHRRLTNQARMSAEAQVQVRSIDTEAITKDREELRKSVEAQLDEDPAYRAMRFLQDREIADAPRLPDVLTDGNGAPRKLNRAEFVQTFGAEAVAKMPKGSFATKVGEGVGAEELALGLGFESGNELVSAITNKEPRDAVVSKRVQAGIDEKYGPALQRIKEAAMNAIHNEDAAHATLMELRALAKQVDPQTSARVKTVDLESMKDQARRLIDQTPVGQLDPARFARNERASALRAAELWGRGEKEKAVTEKEARLLNQVLYREARDRMERLEAARKGLEKTSDEARGRMGKADPSYRDVHDALLEAVGLTDKQPGQARATLDAMLQVAQADAQPVAFDVDAVRQLIEQPKDWNELTTDEAQTVVDAATNIRHIARRSLEVEVGAKAYDKEEFLAKLADRVNRAKDALPLLPPGETARSRGAWQKVRAGLRSAAAQVENIETFAHILDGGDEGPYHDLLVNSRLDARTTEVKLTHEVLMKLREAFAAIPKDILKRRAETVDLGDMTLIPGRFAKVYTRDQLWMLFLNSGNTGNLQRLRDGNQLSEANRKKALSMLSKPETDFLQGVLDTVQSLYPHVAAAYEKRTGLPLGKVEATPISVNGVEYAGGYFPLKYRSEAAQGQMQEINAIKDLFPSNAPPAPDRGHTKARQQKVSAPLDLEWSTLQAHLANVIHDVSYSDWVRQTGGIVLKPRTPGTVPSFSETVTAHVGPEREKQILPWLRDVASARADSVSQHVGNVFDKVGGFARRRAALGAMGFNFPVLGRHSLDAFRTLLEKDAIPAHKVANAYRLVLNPGNWNLPEFAQSREIAYHEAKHADNLRLELQRMGGTWDRVEKFDDAVSHVAFAAQLKLDGFTTRAAFKAAYDHSVDEGLLPDEAVKRADDILRRAFPSGDIAEKPPLMRSKQGWASALMFYGWANNSYNALARKGHNFIATMGSDAGFNTKAARVAKDAGAVLGTGMIEALGMYLAGRGPGKDDTAEERAHWALEEALLYPVDTIPIVGPIAKSVITGHAINPTVDPGISLAVDYGKMAQSLLHKKAEGHNFTDEERFFWALEGAGVTMGLSGFSRRTIGTAGKMATGEVAYEGPVGAAGNLLYGVKKNKVATPPSDIQDLLGQR